MLLGQCWLLLVILGLHIHVHASVIAQIDRASLQHRHTSPLALSQPPLGFIDRILQRLERRARPGRGGKGWLWPLFPPPPASGPVNATYGVPPIPPALGTISDTPRFVACGKGTQKYECRGGTWVIVDASAWLSQCGTLVILGTHLYYNGMPAFNFMQSQNSSTAYFIGTETLTTPSPNSDPNFNNMNWTRLERKDGDLAKTVFMVQTNGGKPAGGESCESGQQEVGFWAAWEFYS